MGQLQTYQPDQIFQMAQPRAGETKLGQRVHTLASLKDLNHTTCKFVLLGLPEDVGVRANGGIGGTNTSWTPTLHALMMSQSTKRFSGQELAVLGYMDFTLEMALADQCDLQNNTGVERIRQLVSIIDQQVSALIQKIVQAGKIPIVVGGGHNNAYPIIKSLANHHQRGINTINIDAHADFRALEGRHSGNGFSYAMQEGHLAKYAVLGLHESYNSQSMLADLQNHPKQNFYTFFEDYLRQHRSCRQDFEYVMHFCAGTCGLEIDMDSMTGALSSAGSLTGFSANQVREMIAQTASRKFAYLHIAEGAATLADGRSSPWTTKLIATLISDFIKAQS